MCECLLSNKANNHRTGTITLDIWGNKEAGGLPFRGIHIPHGRTAEAGLHD